VSLKFPHCFPNYDMFKIRQYYQSTFGFCILSAMAKVGRKPIFDKAMTVAERQRRSRYFRALFGKMTEKWKHRDSRRADYWQNGDPEWVAHKIAQACFNYRENRPNWDRWAAISNEVQTHLYRMEDAFAPFRDCNPLVPDKQE
jgi:hypothetical protein